MFISVECAECERTYQRTVLNTDGCPNCGSKEESVSYSGNYNSGDYIYLDETEEEKIAYKKYIERENYLHFGKPSVLARLVKKVKEKLNVLRKY